MTLNEAISDIVFALIKKAELVCAYYGLNRLHFSNVENYKNGMWPRVGSFLFTIKLHDGGVWIQYQTI